MTDRPSLVFRDRFRSPVRRGRVIGSSSSEEPDEEPGATARLRLGVDVEGVLGVDGDALRIQPLVRPGWGRAGLAYGPFSAQPGRVLAVHVLNGHHASQTHPPRSFLRQVARWLVGSGATPPGPRLRRFLRHHPRVPHRRRLRSWLVNRRLGELSLVDNLAVGWFPTTAPTDPREGACSLVVRATPATNGCLTATVAGQPFPALAELHNVPLALVVVLRDQGALYLAGSLAGTAGLPELPRLRPLAIDPGVPAARLGAEPDRPLYVGIHQSILGEIGFSVDTRVHEVQLLDSPPLARWCTTAVLADRLTGSGPLVGTADEHGQRWSAPADGDDAFRRGPEGVTTATAVAADQLVVLAPAAPTVIGLIHAVVEPGPTPGRVGIAWRVTDHGHWRLLLGEQEAAVEEVIGDRVVRTLTTTAGMGRGDGVAVAVQLVDDGHGVRVALDGRVVLDVADLAPPATHAPAGAATTGLTAAAGAAARTASLPLRGEIGLYAGEGWGSARLRDLEAHPDTVRVDDLVIAPAAVPEGERLVIDESLRGPAADLAGHRSARQPDGCIEWQRSAGTGRFLLGPEGTRVDATRDRPVPGRTAYSCPWPDPELADVSVTITPPGAERGEGHCGRGGLVFWQDADHQLIVNTWLDDNFEGSSISSFLTVDGFEDVFDAVWVNVGPRIRWGRPYTLRVRFDGMTFAASVDDDLVLFRRLDDIYPGVDRLRIRRVGLVANWEWGLDTGSRFERFQARASR